MTKRLLLFILINGFLSICVLNYTKPKVPLIEQASKLNSKLFFQEHTDRFLQRKQHLESICEKYSYKPVKVDQYYFLEIKNRNISVCLHPKVNDIA